MKRLLFLRLAATGLARNRQMSLPFFFTAAGMVGVQYLFRYLQAAPAVEGVYGAPAVRSLMAIGANVLAFFSLLFLFYTHSFLMRRRKKEFGLYHALGMGKRHLGIILAWETLLLGAGSIAAGLVPGMLLAKLAELGLVRLAGGPVDYGLHVDLPAALATAAVFGGIFVLLLAGGLRQILFARSLALLQGEAKGEKPPRANYLLGGLGVLTLAGAYCIAVLCTNPADSLALFFPAAALVTAGSYLLLMAGSVALCRLLQKKKGYYYRRAHFVSVGFMSWRMKRNGAGLASICLLSTMVLVMLSGAASLYFGVEEAAKTRCPREMCLTFTAEQPGELTDQNRQALAELVQRETAACGGAAAEVWSYHSLQIAGVVKEGRVMTDRQGMDEALTFSQIWQFVFLDLQEYNRLYGAAESLPAGQALLCLPQGCEWPQSQIAFAGGGSLPVARLGAAPTLSEFTVTAFPTAVVAVHDLSEAARVLSPLKGQEGQLVVEQWDYAFNTGLSDAAQKPLYDRLCAALAGKVTAGRYGRYSLSCENRAVWRGESLSLFGGVLYLALLLSLVFLCGTVLIVYYKQLSEGYEDQSRFGILQQVGMTDREIRKSVNSQLLTVFFLPLALATLHLGFAFPMVRRVLRLFGLHQAGLYALITLGCLVAFGLFYLLVYRLTSNVYYRLAVRGGRPS